ncbi:MAG TPA: hemolysin family protein [Micromonosporaceae bacterium]|nr:hemolysin family protein [Micromonosporaceae bacterium]
MGDYGGQLLLVGVLVLLNALFAGSEMALVSLRDSQLERLAARGGAGKVLARLVRDPNRFLATIQIGITVAGFLASATAAVSLAQPLVEPLGFLGGAARPTAIVLVTVVLSFLTLVLGELAPKRWAMQRAESWALLAARPLDALAKVTRPVVWLLGVATDAVVRLFGGDPDRQREEVTAEELRELVIAQKAFTPQQRTIMEGAFEIADRVLRQVVVPRRAVLTLPAAMPVAEARQRLAESGHSRAPVVRGADLDDVLGVVHLRDLLGDSGTVGDVARPSLLLPESLRVSEAMRRMRTEREQLALVVDERGAVDGIVTLEDLIEEVVGEIYDETDRDVLAARHGPDGVVELPGLFPVHDLDDVGVRLDGRPPGEYATVAGLVLAVLGRIPDGPGDEVRLDGWTVEVTAVERRAITGVRLRPTTDPARGV